jgi:hypothetical protein
VFAKKPPRDALGNLKRIEIPRDCGEEGRLGGLIRRRQQSRDCVEATIEADSDEVDEVLDTNEDDNFYQGGDDDVWTKMQELEMVDVDLLEYLRSLVAERNLVNTLSHIICTVDAKKVFFDY